MLIPHFPPALAEMLSALQNRSEPFWPLKSGRGALKSMPDSLNAVVPRINCVALHGVIGVELLERHEGERKHVVFSTVVVVREHML